MIGTPDLLSRELNAEFSIVVQQQVQFDRALRPAKLRPIKHAHRQVEDAPVQAHQLVFKTELLPPALASHELLAFAEQLLKHRLVKPPRPMLVSIRQRGLLGRHRHSQVFQLPLATRQPTANVTQRMRASQLAKQRRHELAPTREAPRVPLGFVLLHRLLEISALEKLQHLRENAAYFVHRLSLLRLFWFFLEPNPAYQELRLSSGGASPFSYPLIWTAVCGNTLSSYGKSRARMIVFSPQQSTRAHGESFDGSPDELWNTLFPPQ